MYFYLIILLFTQFIHIFKEGIMVNKVNDFISSIGFSNFDVLKLESSLILCADVLINFISSNAFRYSEIAEYQAYLSNLIDFKYSNHFYNSSILTEKIEVLVIDSELVLSQETNSVLNKLNNNHFIKISLNLPKHVLICNLLEVFSVLLSFSPLLAQIFIVLTFVVLIPFILLYILYSYFLFFFFFFFFFFFKKKKKKKKKK